MASNEKKILDKLSEIIIDDDDDEKNMDTASINSVEEQKLLNPTATVDDVLMYLKRIDVKIDAHAAVNNNFTKSANVRFTTIEEKADNHGDRIQKLEKQLALIESNGSTSSSTATVSEWGEQRRLRNNIHVIGLPHSDGENLTKITMDICGFLGVVINPNDILSAYRVRSTNSGMFIAKFISFDTKANLLAAKKKKKITVGNIMSASCSSNCASNEIYINSHVTPYVNRLLHRGRLAVNDKKLAACWVTSNCLMVKKTIDSEPIQIRTYEELCAVLGTVSEQLSEPKSSNGKRPRGHNDSLSPSLEAQPKPKQRHGSRGKIPGPKSSKQENAKQRLPQQGINKNK